MTTGTPQSEIASEGLQQVKPLPVSVTLPVVFWPDRLHHVKVKVLGYTAVNAPRAKQQLDMFPNRSGC